MIFNYDRCVERYLHAAIKSFYDRSDSQAADLVNRVDICHPYGTVGLLPWQIGGHASQDFVDFGRLPANTDDLIHVSRKIRTFTEATHEAIAARASGLLKEAGRVVFLGFSFQQQNLDLLYPESIAKRPREIFSTTKGLTNHDFKILETYLASRAGIDRENIYFKISPGTCTEVLSEYGRAISMHI